MKTLSIVFTGLILIPVIGVMYSSFYYYLYDGKIWTKEIIHFVEKKIIIQAIIYLAFFMLSLFLTIKKKYVGNCILFGCYVVFWIVKIIFFLYA
jgi:hypothetical protein